MGWRGNRFGIMVDLNRGGMVTSLSIAVDLDEAVMALVGGRTAVVDWVDFAVDFNVVD